MFTFSFLHFTTKSFLFTSFHESINAFNSGDSIVPLSGDLHSNPPSLIPCLAQCENPKGVGSVGDDSWYIRAHRNIVHLSFGVVRVHVQLSDFLVTLKVVTLLEAE